MPSAVWQTPNDVWPWPDSLDALLAAPAHSLVLENQKMRVVQTRIGPGQTVPEHTHRLAGVRFIEIWSDLMRRDQPGNVLVDTRRLADRPRLNPRLWPEPLPPHTVENAGGVAFNRVPVEIKDAR
jgi:hypothetical protein